MTKQFIPVLDDVHIALLGRICPGIKFIEIEGLTMAGNSSYMLLANPVKQEENAPTEEPKDTHEEPIPETTPGE